MTSEALVILEETAHELVVWKPAGLASETRDPRAESVLSLLAARGLTPKLPHRLDRVTRGVLLVCLSPEAIAFHNAQIAARRWEKTYLARVAGDPTSFLGEHRAFLGEDGGRARIVRSGGKPARLEIVAAAPVPDRAQRWHAVIRLHTGRFHQIRVMCASLGLPLAGDPLYDPEPRDPDEFYLEHAILEYERFDTRELTTIRRRDYAGRGPLAPEIATRLFS